MKVNNKNIRTTLLPFTDIAAKTSQINFKSKSSTLTSTIFRFHIFKLELESIITAKY